MRKKRDTMHSLILFSSVMSIFFFNGSKSGVQFFKVCLKFGKGALKEYEFQMFWTVNIINVANHYTVSRRQFKRVNLSALQLWFNPSW